MGAWAFVALLVAGLPAGDEPGGSGAERRVGGGCVGTPTLMSYARQAERPVAVRQAPPREAARERRRPSRCFRLAGWPE